MLDEDDAEGEPLAEGMPVESTHGEPLGKLAALLIEEEEDEAEFLLLAADGKEHLVPFESVLAVEGGKLLLDVPVENVARFPVIAPGGEPTEEQMQAAYELYDEGASLDDDEDDD